MKVRNAEAIVISRFKLLDWETDKFSLLVANLSNLSMKSFSWIVRFLVVKQVCEHIVRVNTGLPKQAPVL